MFVRYRYERFGFLKSVFRISHLGCSFGYPRSFPELLWHFALNLIFSKCFFKDTLTLDSNPRLWKKQLCWSSCGTNQVKTVTKGGAASSRKCFSTQIRVWLLWLIVDLNWLITFLISRWNYRFVCRIIFLIKQYPFRTNQWNNVTHKET